MEEKIETGAAQPQKMTYEQLEEVCHQLKEQLDKQQEFFATKMKELNMVNIFKRIDYLFKVVEDQDKGFSSDFVVKAIEELEQLLTLDEAKEETKE